MRDVFEALVGEQERLDAYLVALPAVRWDAPSLCTGWSVSDVVLHLAQTEEAVAGAVQGRSLRDAGGAGGSGAGAAGASIDDVMAQWVERERGGDHAAVLERWRVARRAAVDALRSCAPDGRIPWAVTSLKPVTLATTRLAEHWAHALDVSAPFGDDWPDGEQLWHIARLAHRTLPYAFACNGAPRPGPVRLELAAPDGSAWTFGEADAPSVVRGPASTFCRLAARRLDALDATEVAATGPDGPDVLRYVRTYA